MMNEEHSDFQKFTISLKGLSQWFCVNLNKTIHVPQHSENRFKMHLSNL